MLATLEQNDDTMNDLRKAAQACLDRWDSPAWEWSKQGPTAALFAELRRALARQNDALMAHPDCADQGHPGCEVCDD
jgi:hypothetical protein